LTDSVLVWGTGTPESACCLCPISWPSPMADATSRLPPACTTGWTAAEPRGPDGAERLNLLADAPPLRRRYPRPPHLRPHHGHHPMTPVARAASGARGSWSRAPQDPLSYARRPIRQWRRAHSIRLIGAAGLSDRPTVQSRRSRPDWIFGDACIGEQKPPSAFEKIIIESAVTSWPVPVTL
jgi:hypothetical protein